MDRDSPPSNAARPSCQLGNARIVPALRFHASVRHVLPHAAMLVDSLQEELEQLIPAIGDARSKLSHHVVECLLELRVQTIDHILDLVRIPVMWAADYGDVGQSRSEATLVVFLH